MLNKIDLFQLNQMIQAGKTGHECALFFKVSDAAVSQARRKLKNGMIKSVVMESAHQVLENELNTFDQLTRINRDTIQLLDFLKSWVSGDKKALKLVAKTHFLKGIQYKDPAELILKAAREVLEQLRYQSQVFEKLYDMKCVADFQAAVIAEIEKASPEVKNEIIQRLKQRNIIRRSITS